MRVGIISDTHGHVDLTRPAVRMFESLEVERVLHCGDIGSPEVVELFAAWPTDFVFGNCDTDATSAAAAIERAGQTCHGEFGDLEIDGVRIALLHSHDRRLFSRVDRQRPIRLVCYGHTHVAADRTAGRHAGRQSRRDLPGAARIRWRCSICPQNTATIIEL